MKKYILIIALFFLAMGARAQDYKSGWERQVTRNGMEQTFDLNDLNMGNINIRDFITLKNGKMILELHDNTDFARLYGMDTIIGRFLNEIAFYRDSLDANNPGNVHIDYVWHDDRPTTELRFKRYHNDGDLFVNRKGEVSKLKTELDTIRIVLCVSGKTVVSRVRGGKPKIQGKVPFTPKYNVIVTFYVNNYTDLEKIISEKKMINHALDTLCALQSAVSEKRASEHPSTAVYNPYAPVDYPTILHKTLLKFENDQWVRAFTHQNAGILTVSCGASLIMNTMAPTADINIGYVSQWRKNDSKDNTSYTIGFSPYFFFGRDAQNNFHVYDNWFITGEICSYGGSLTDSRIKYHNSFGIGYLMTQKGNYFPGQTWKAYTHIQLTHRIMVGPELIAVNGFKQFFPGISLKML